MSQALAFLLVHVIFSTKDRAPLLTPAIRDRQEEHHKKQT